MNQGLQFPLIVVNPSAVDNHRTQASRVQALLPWEESQPVQFLVGGRGL